MERNTILEKNNEQSLSVIRYFIWVSVLLTALKYNSLAYQARVNTLSKLIKTTKKRKIKTNFEGTINRFS